MLEYLFCTKSKRYRCNTAFMNWNNKIYALHEGDMPYELNIDYKNYNISTVKRLHYNSVFSTTAHPIVNKKRVIFICMVITTMILFVENLYSMFLIKR